MREDHTTRRETRRRLWEEQGKICVYCERKITYDKASLDHIIPVHHLEDNIGPENLAVTCKYCNISKGDMFVFTNLYDRIVYPIQVVPVIYQDYYIHSTKKIRKLF